MEYFMIGVSWVGKLTVMVVGTLALIKKNGLVFLV